MTNGFTSPAESRTRGTRSVALAIVLSPWLWGLLLTAGFYAAVELSPIWPAWVYRYFCMHWTERVLMGLTFIGLAILAIKSLTVSWEWSAFRRVPDFGIPDPTAPIEDKYAGLQQRVDQLQETSHETYWSHRLQHLLTYFRNSPAANGTNEHIAYLSEASQDRLHASYALMNTIVWAIPIIGFLGTVMGITLAIASLTPDQLDTALSSVTRDLALAFDTTAIALTSSLVLGFLSLFVKRSEEQLLTEIDERCRLEIHRCFPEVPDQNPLLEAQSQTAAQLLQHSETLLSEHTSGWRETMDEFRSRWSQLIEDSQRQLQASLQVSASETVSDHARQLQAFREEFTTAYGAVSQAVAADLGSLATQRDLANEELRTTLSAFARDFQEGLARNLQQQQAGTAQLIALLADRLQGYQAAIENWQAQYSVLANASAQHSLRLHQQTETLQQLVGQETELVRVEQRLSENLDVLRTAETFDETLHNLTAAVHLLTARARAA